MPPRQKLLLISLVAAVLLWQGGGTIWHWLFGPIVQLRQDLVSVQERVDEKREQAISIEQAKAKLRNWQLRSLPPDPGKKKRPDALEAQRQYSEWLTEVAHAVGFEELSVVPQRRSVSPKNVYVEVVVQIDGTGRLSQLYELLDRFYRTDLLQRIGRLQVVTEDVLGDPPVKFSLEASGLALADAPSRRTLFPRTTLAADIDSEASQLTVSSSEGFPKSLPFRVRVDHELLEVTAVTDTVWTVQRGMERTVRAEHLKKSQLKFMPTSKAVSELNEQAMRELVRTNPFVKPTPATDYEMTFGPFPTAVVTRGKSLELMLAAKDFDPARGEPIYRLVGSPPMGLSLNETTGKLLWKPDVKLAAGRYPLIVEAVHPTAAGGKLSEELELSLVDPNTAPKIAPIARQSVYRSRTLRFNVTATDQDVPPQSLTYKLEAGAPTGCAIDATQGELTWTPSDDQPFGPANVTIRVSDSGVPQQTATVSITIDVKEDSARTTRLIGIVGIDDEPEAWFFDQAANQKTVLRTGDPLQVADIQAVITAMTSESITVMIGDAIHRLKLGDTLRSLTPPAAKQ